MQVETMPIEFETHKIEAVADLFEAARLARGSFGREVWFRGQSRSSWQLQPEIQRPFLDGKNDLRRYAESAEANMTVEFKLLAHSRRTNCPGPDDAAGWLCLMRHYGLPTRILDWTSSILVAAFFALRKWREHKEAKESSVVWALAPHILNARDDPQHKHALLVLSGQNARVRGAIGAAFYDTDKVPESRGIIAVIPPQVDQRMLLQHSTFTVHSDPCPMDDLPDARDYLKRFEVPFGKQKELLDDLDSAGIRPSTLFPDLDNLAKDLQKIQQSVASRLAGQGLTIQPTAPPDDSSARAGPSQP
ncbi:MAG: FRG domain-containing protein [Planctomycetota bacterium]|nr:FRG domain-containing protein [Planctomycetota bacterium]